MVSASRSLPLRITRARDNVLGKVRTIVARSNITEQQWRILRVLDEFGPMDATTLADRSSLLLPSQTRILQAMVQRELVERRPDPLDRRRQTLVLGVEGRRVIAEHEAEYEAMAVQMQDQLGLARMELLLELLEELEKL